MTSWLRPKSKQELTPQPTIHNGGVRPVHSGRTADGENRPRGATTATAFDAATRYPNSRRNDGRHRTSVLPPEARAQSISHKLSDLGKVMGGGPSPSGREKVRMTDQELTEHARLQAMRIEAQVRPWTAAQSDGVAPHWSRKRDAGRLSVYTTKNESRFAIAAVGEVPCGVQDLLSLFNYSTDGEFRGLMGRLWGDHEVQDAEILRTIQSSYGNSSSERLRLKRLQFERSTLSAPDEEWCYLDHVQPQYQTESKLLALQGFTRTVSTLHPHDVYASDQGELKRRKAKAKFGLDCVAGHHFEAIDSPSSGRKMTRVVFYGEHKKASSSGSGRDPCALPYNTIKMRLIRMVNCTNILMDVIAQRLNQQPVTMNVPRQTTTMRRQRVASADPNVRSISSSVSSWSSDDNDASSMAKATAAAAGAGPSTGCGVCTRLRSVGHLVCCRACGFLVCIRCSRDDESAHSHPSQENRRICKTCQFKSKQRSEPVLVNVHDQEDSFPAKPVKSRATSQPQIGRKDSQTPAPTTDVTAASPPVDVGRSTMKLAGLLETTLQSADSDAKKASMLTVLKYLMDQDTKNATGTSTSMNVDPPKPAPIRKMHSTPSRRQNFYQAPVLAANGSGGKNQPLVQPRIERPGKKLYERPDAVYPSKVKLFNDPHDS